MKKNLRNILALSLALMTTVSFAQDWNADSRTRIDMSGDGDEMSTDQRATIGATWGADEDWGIHVSSDVNYAFDDNTEGALTARVYEAYASCDLMGYTVLTAGRTALDYGSGAIMSSNQWTTGARTTWDGFRFDLTGIEMADITLGYGKVSGAAYDGVAAADAVAGSDATPGTYAGNDTNNVVVYTPGTDAIAAVNAGDNAGTTNMWVNIAKGDGDWSANLLYMSNSVGAGDAATAMGIDLSYAMMGGDLGLNVSYNTNSGDPGADEDEDMMSIGATYNVSEQLSVTANQTTYGENGFDLAGTNMDGTWGNAGEIGYLDPNDQDRNIGIAYTMGDFNLGATMHQITNTGDDMEDYDRSAMDISLGYTMSDNANLSLKYATDNYGGDDDQKFMWITLNIRP